MRYLPAILAALALSACADVSRNLYEGVKIRNDAGRSPNEHAMTPAPTYEQYKKEREAE